MGWIAGEAIVPLTEATSRAIYFFGKKSSENHGEQRLVFGKQKTVALKSPPRNPIVIYGNPFSNRERGRIAMPPLFV
ncbi:MULTISPECIES: hypothetical protein [unclassified Okeania]|uniref:hypothetical protein n=1 Tax=unclassified Okeania TaxID=2634635 RepID=UPI00257BA48E|nr:MULTISPECIES: hypothetical protein [unclassified Okeania]